MKHVVNWREVLAGGIALPLLCNPLRLLLFGWGWHYHVLPLSSMDTASLASLVPLLIQGLSLGLMQLLGSRAQWEGNPEPCLQHCSVIHFAETCALSRLSLGSEPHPQD